MTAATDTLLIGDFVLDPFFFQRLFLCSVIPPFLLRLFGFGFSIALLAAHRFRRWHLLRALAIDVALEGVELALLLQKLLPQALGFLAKRALMEFFLGDCHRECVLNNCSAMAIFLPDFLCRKVGRQRRR